MLASLSHKNERGIPRYCGRILVEGWWIDGAGMPAKKGRGAIAGVA